MTLNLAAGLENLFKYLFLVRAFGEIDGHLLRHKIDGKTVYAGNLLCGILGFSGTMRAVNFDFVDLFHDFQSPVQNLTIKRLFNRSAYSILFLRQKINTFRTSTAKTAKIVAKKEHIMSKECTHSHETFGQFGIAAEFFRSLCDETRIKIFWILCHSEECGVGLAERLGISSPAAAHHLRVLRECGLIDSRRDGKEVWYRLADSETAMIMHSAVESIMEIACPDDETGTTNSETVRKVHDHLVEHLDERVTIEELSRMFHINATTLKEAFKAEYGTSLAAHIKEHRMEKAASLLRESRLSISDIAKSVGFESRSRFTTAFKDAYGVLPSEYRSSLRSQ